MTIQSTDIKLRASERMTDTPDGGGRRTLNVIADGVAGNVFPKVSRVDSVYGRVNLRKVFGHVDTPSGDTYAGAHFVVTDAPDNDRIHVTAFSTGSDYDNRNAARDRIESYVIAGPESRMTMYGRQLVGVQALLLYQRVEEPLPEIGEVFVLSNETGGIKVAQQFVAIQDMSHEVRTFTDDKGDFQKRVVTLTIGAPLRYEFVGFETPSRLSGSPPGALFRSTTVADAARYFGIQPLTEPAGAGELSMQVDSVYTKIVPTTQRETALSVVGIAGAVSEVVTGRQANTGLLELNYWAHTEVKFYQKIKKGSILARSSALFPWRADDGNGNLQIDGSVTQKWNFLVDYENGTLKPASNDAGFDSASIAAGCFTFATTVEVSNPAHTREIEITLGTRGTVHTPVISPLPAPATLIVDYRALGKWYRLRDDGTGELSGGDAAYGTGTVNYLTGGVIITLGSLPDVGSSILLSWGSPAHYEVKTDDAGTTAKVAITLPDLPVKRASAVVTYYVNSVATTAGAGLSGAIAGANGVTGSINHMTGLMTLEFGGKLPDAGSLISVVYKQVVAAEPGATSPVLSGTFPALTPTVLSGYPFDAGSLMGAVTLKAHFETFSINTDSTKIVQFYDDGQGNLVIPKGVSVTSFVDQPLPLSSGAHAGYANNLAQGVTSAETIVGTINYSTGEIVMLSASIPVTMQVWSATSTAGTTAMSWVAGSFEAFIDGTENATWTSLGTAIAASDANKLLSIDLGDHPLQVDLTRTTARSVVAGSVMFTLGGKTYIDRNGTVYTDVDTLSGAGLTAGSINYDTGVVSLTHWANNVNAALSVQSCLTKYGNWTAVDAFFRTVGSPIRPASLYVQVAADDGTLITGLADLHGNITGPYMRGKVEQTMGVARVAFGQMVLATGNELKPWYDATTLEGGYVWKPKAVQPDTLRYSTVVLSNLPLNADILGLDPVRLPSDGRVPIYRSADVVVVHNTQSYAVGIPTAAQVVNVGRTGLSALWLEDVNKLKLPLTLYAANLDAGTVTMAADLSLTGYVTPIVAKHRIEEMGLLSDVQINGQITLTAPLLRDYPLGSFVSSALLFGDMFSRVTGVFDQATWTAVWSDALIGSQATAQYNDVDYPLAVNNNAAVTDRWRINFTSTTTFQVISENMGVIATGTTTADLAPINPLTGVAYFTLQSAGWGLAGSWSVGNQLRFNTVGAAAPIWLARTVLPGATLAGDSFDAQLRGDVD